MSQPCETSGHPSTSAIEQQQQTQSTTTHATSQPQNKRQKRSSTSSNGPASDTRSASSRRRSATTDVPSSGPNAGASRTAQRSTTSPNNMSSVNYTRTGRVSKAKKGLKVHDCECGRSYTRAEHLRRHQRNHAQEEAMTCRYPNCGKTFYRSDLLQRHEERHNEVGRTSRQLSVSSTERSTHASPMPAPVSLPSEVFNTLPSTAPYSAHQMLSPQPEVTVFPRYTQDLFRTPQLPRTPKTASANSGNLFFRSASNFKSTPNDQKQQNVAPYPSRHSISSSVLVDGSMAPSLAWHDSFAQSPYSCSSGYASPIPGPDYSQIYATPPYGPSIMRTRASSNASFIEPWAHAPHSPTLSVSHMPYSWPPDEKNIIVSSFPYAPVSYPTAGMSLQASVEDMAHYGPFDPNTVVQMDLQERVELFPDQHYGMSQVAHTYPFDQYLNNYWRLFHPTFPVVHRFTFASVEPCPMLFAAMIAIGAQYNIDACAKRTAISLHKRCMALLDRRLKLNMIGCDRLCDYQAIFLVEVFAQYRALRCPKTLSASCIDMYKKLEGVPTFAPSTISELTSFASTHDDDVQARWTQWVRMSTKQHLLLSCYVLEYQRTALLVRNPEPSLRTRINDLPFPAHSSLWDATNADDWTATARRFSDMPRVLSEVWSHPSTEHYDAFQSSVLIAFNYSQLGAPHLDSRIERLLQTSPTTQHQLMTAKLARLVPMRALLAVSGESWILDTKVNPPAEFFTLRNTLQAWNNQLWSTLEEPCSTHEALRISVGILQLAFTNQDSFNLAMGDEMGLLLAALVVWSITVAAGTRLATSELSMDSSFPALELQPNEANILHTPDASLTATPATSWDSMPQILELSDDTRSPPAMSNHSDRKFSVPHSEIAINVPRFLHTVIEDLSSLRVTSCRNGCSSLLLWVKMRLRGTSLSTAVVDPGLTGDDYGGLIQCILGQIEKMLSQGWEGWDF